MIITSRFFLVLTCESDSCIFLVLERTEFDLSKINWLRDVILLIPIALVPWGRFSLGYTPIRPKINWLRGVILLIPIVLVPWIRSQS